MDEEEVSGNTADLESSTSTIIGRPLNAKGVTGEIDDFSIFNRVVSSLELRAAAAIGPPLPTSLYPDGFALQLSGWLVSSRDISVAPLEEGSISFYILLQRPDLQQNQRMRFLSMQHVAAPLQQFKINLETAVHDSSWMIVLSSPTEGIHLQTRLKSNSWQHFSFSWNAGGNLALYLDGEVKAKRPWVPSSRISGVGVFRLGDCQLSHDVFIDDLSIWNKAIAGSTLWDFSFRPREDDYEFFMLPTLIGFWRFNDFTSTQLLNNRMQGYPWAAIPLQLESCDTKPKSLPFKPAMRESALAVVSYPGKLVELIICPYTQSDYATLRMKEGNGWKYWLKSGTETLPTTDDTSVNISPCNPLDEKANIDVQIPVNTSPGPYQVLFEICDEDVCITDRRSFHILRPPLAQQPPSAGPTIHSDTRSLTVNGFRVKDVDAVEHGSDYRLNIAMQETSFLSLSEPYLLGYGSPGYGDGINDITLSGRGELNVINAVLEELHVSFEKNRQLSSGTLEVIELSSPRGLSTASSWRAALLLSSIPRVQNVMLALSASSESLYLEVSVNLFPFHSEEHYECLFVWPNGTTKAIVAAETLAEASTIFCKTLWLSDPSELLLSVQTPQFVSMTHKIVAPSLPAPLEVSPAAASMDGGELLTVTIDRPIISAFSASYIACVFGEIRVPITVLNSYLLKCRTPKAASAGIVPFRLGWRLTSSYDQGTLDFKYMSKSWVVYTKPRVLVEGTASSVQLVGVFDLPENVSCWLPTGQPAPAVVSRSRLVVCKFNTLGTPGMPEPVNIYVGHFLDGRSQILATTAVTLAPPIEPRQFTIQAMSSGAASITFSLNHFMLYGSLECVLVQYSSMFRVPVTLHSTTPECEAPLSPGLWVATIQQRQAPHAASYPVTLLYAEAQPRWGSRPQAVLGLSKANKAILIIAVALESLLAPHASICKIDGGNWTLDTSSVFFLHSGIACQFSQSNYSWLSEKRATVYLVGGEQMRDLGVVNVPKALHYQELTAVGFLDTSVIVKIRSNLHTAIVGNLSDLHLSISEDRLVVRCPPGKDEAGWYSGELTIDPHVSIATVNVECVALPPVSLTSLLEAEQPHIFVSGLIEEQKLLSGCRIARNVHGHLVSISESTMACYMEDSAPNLQTSAVVEFKTNAGDFIVGGTLLLDFPAISFEPKSVMGWESDRLVTIKSAGFQSGELQYRCNNDSDIIILNAQTIQCRPHVLEHSLEVTLFRVDGQVAVVHHIPVAEKPVQAFVPTTVNPGQCFDVNMSGPTYSQFQGGMPYIRIGQLIAPAHWTALATIKTCIPATVHIIGKVQGSLVVGTHIEVPLAFQIVPAIPERVRCRESKNGVAIYAPEYLTDLETLLTCVFETAEEVVTSPLALEFKCFSPPFPWNHLSIALNGTRIASCDFSSPLVATSAEEPGTPLNAARPIPRRSELRIRMHSGDVFPPFSGGSLLLVSEDHYAPSLAHDYTCSIGLMNLTTRVVNDSALECLLPSLSSIPEQYVHAILHGSFAPVSLVSRGAGLVAAGPWTARYLSRGAALVSVQPAVGLAFHATRVAFEVRELLRTEKIHCKFGEEVVEGDRISEDFVVCTAPALEPQTIDVGLLINERDPLPAAESFTFEYILDPRVDSVEILRSTAGMKVLIFGENIRPEVLRCEVGKASVPLRRITSQIHVCSLWFNFEQSCSDFLLIKQAYSNHRLYETPLKCAVSTSLGAGIFPSIGHVGTSTTLAIEATEEIFSPADVLMCGFQCKGDWITSRVTAIDSHTILCQTPVLSEPQSIEVFNCVNETCTFRGSFAVVPPPSVHAIFPTVGPIFSSNPVTITGHNFMSSGIVMSRFGLETPAACTIISDSKIICKPRDVQAVGQKPIFLSLNGKDFQKVSEFTFLHPLKITRVAPTTISRGVGAVELQVKNAALDLPIWCTIGDHQGVAIRPNRSVALLLCPIYNLKPGRYRVGISYNQLDVAYAPQRIEIIDRGVLLHVNDWISSPTSGGSLLLVSEDHYAPSLAHDYTCSIGLMNLTTRVVNDSALECLLPSLSSIPEQYVHAILHGSFAPVSLVSRGAGLVAAGPWTARYLSRGAALVSVQPAVGLAFHATRVAFEVRELLRTEKIHCKFGEEVVEGDRISEDFVVCTAPALEPQTIDVGLLINERDPLPAAESFKFHFVMKPEIPNPLYLKKGERRWVQFPSLDLRGLQCWFFNGLSKTLVDPIGDSCLLPSECEEEKCKLEIYSGDHEMYRWTIDTQAAPLVEQAILYDFAANCANCGAIIILYGSGLNIDLCEKHGTAWVDHSMLICDGSSAGLTVPIPIDASHTVIITPLATSSALDGMGSIHFRTSSPLPPHLPVICTSSSGRYALKRFSKFGISCELPTAYSQDSELHLVIGHSVLSTVALPDPPRQSKQSIQMVGVYSGAQWLEVEFWSEEAFVLHSCAVNGSLTPAEASPLESNIWRCTFTQHTDTHDLVVHWLDAFGSSQQNVFSIPQGLNVGVNSQLVDPSRQPFVEVKATQQLFWNGSCCIVQRDHPTCFGVSSQTSGIVHCPLNEDLQGPFVLKLIPENNETHAASILLYALHQDRAHGKFAVECLRNSTHECLALPGEVVCLRSSILPLVEQSGQLVLGTYRLNVTWANNHVCGRLPSYIPPGHFHLKVRLDELLLPLNTTVNVLIPPTVSKIEVFEGWIYIYGNNFVQGLLFCRVGEVRASVVVHPDGSGRCDVAVSSLHMPLDILTHQGQVIFSRPALDQHVTIVESMNPHQPILGSSIFFALHSPPSFSVNCKFHLGACNSDHASVFLSPLTSKEPFMCEVPPLAAFAVQGTAFGCVKLVSSANSVLFHSEVAFVPAPTIALTSSDYLYEETFGSVKFLFAEKWIHSEHELWCTFSSSQLRALVLSSNLLECPVFPPRVGIANLEITLGGQYMAVVASRHIEVLPKPTLLTQRVVSHEETKLNIVGKAFDYRASLILDGSSRISPCSIINSTMISCSTAPSQAQGMLHLVDSRIDSFIAQVEMQTMDKPEYLETTALFPIRGKRAEIELRGNQLSRFKAKVDCNTHSLNTSYHCTVIMRNETSASLILSPSPGSGQIELQLSDGLHRIWVRAIGFHPLQLFPSTASVDETGGALITLTNPHVGLPLFSASYAIICAFGTTRVVAVELSLSPFRIVCRTPQLIPGVHRFSLMVETDSGVEIEMWSEAKFIVRAKPMLVSVDPRYLWKPSTAWLRGRNFPRSSTCQVHLKAEDDTHAVDCSIKSAFLASFNFPRGVRHGRYTLSMFIDAQNVSAAQIVELRPPLDFQTYLTDGWLIVKTEIPSFQNETVVVREVSGWVGEADEFDISAHPGVRLLSTPTLSIRDSPLIQLLDARGIPFSEWHFPAKVPLPRIARTASSMNGLHLFGTNLANLPLICRFILTDGYLHNSRVEALSSNFALCNTTSHAFHNLKQADIILGDRSLHRWMPPLMTDGGWRENKSLCSPRAKQYHPSTVFTSLTTLISVSVVDPLRHNGSLCHLGNVTTHSRLLDRHTVGCEFNRLPVGLFSLRFSHPGEYVCEQEIGPVLVLSNFRMEARGGFIAGLPTTVTLLNNGNIPPHLNLECLFEGRRMQARIRGQFASCRIFPRTIGLQPLYVELGTGGPTQLVGTVVNYERPRLYPIQDNACFLNEVCSFHIRGSGLSVLGLFPATVQVGSHTGNCHLGAPNILACSVPPLLQAGFAGVGLIVGGQPLYFEGGSITVNPRPVIMEVISHQDAEGNVSVSLRLPSDAETAYLATGLVKCTLELPGQDVEEYDPLMVLHEFVRCPLPADRNTLNISLAFYPSRVRTDIIPIKWNIDMDPIEHFVEYPQIRVDPQIVPSNYGGGISVVYPLVEPFTCDWLTIDNFTKLASFQGYMNGTVPLCPGPMPWPSNGALLSVQSGSGFVGRASVQVQHPIAWHRVSTFIPLDDAQCVSFEVAHLLVLENLNCLAFERANEIATSPALVELQANHGATGSCCFPSLNRHAPSYVQLGLAIEMREGEALNIPGLSTAIPVIGATPMDRGHQHLLADQDFKFVFRLSHDIAGLEHHLECHSMHSHEPSTIVLQAEAHQGVAVCQGRLTLPGTVKVHLILQDAILSTSSASVELPWKPRNLYPTAISSTVDTSVTVDWTWSPPPNTTVLVELWGTNSGKALVQPMSMFKDGKSTFVALPGSGRLTVYFYQVLRGVRLPLGLPFVLRYTPDILVQAVTPRYVPTFQPTTFEITVLLRNEGSCNVFCFGGAGEKRSVAQAIHVGAVPEGSNVYRCILSGPTTPGKHGYRIGCSEQVSAGLEVEVYNSPSVRTISPTVISVGSPATILITGEFPTIPVRSCRLGNDTGAVIEQSRLQLQCQIRPAQVFSDPKLEISFNGVTWHEIGEVSVVESFVVGGIAPTRGFLKGGTEITVLVQGRDLQMETIPFRCVFTGRESVNMVEAQQMSLRQFICISPVWYTPEDVYVTLEPKLTNAGRRDPAEAGRSHSAHSQVFSYIAEPKLLRADPSTLLLQRQILTIHGLHLDSVTSAWLVAAGSSDSDIAAVVEYRSPSSLRLTVDLSTLTVQETEQFAIILAINEGQEFAEPFPVIVEGTSSIFIEPVTLLEHEPSSISIRLPLMLSTRVLQTPHCRVGGAQSVKGVWNSASPNRFTCPVPGLDAGKYTVEVSFDQKQWMAISATSLTVSPLPTIATTNPHSGPDRGGTVVQFFGANLNSTELACRWSEAVTTPLRVLNQTYGLCFSPRMQTAAGHHALRLITANGQEISLTSFEFYQEVHVLNTVPSYVFAGVEQDIIVVAENLIHSGLLNCVITNLTTKEILYRQNPLWINDSSIMCRNITLQPGTGYGLSVTNNGVDLSMPRSLPCYRPPQIRDISPVVVPHSAAIDIAVRGSFFSQWKSIQCYFAGEVFNSKVLSDQLVLCQGIIAHQTGVHTLSLLLNGQLLTFSRAGELQVSSAVVLEEVAPPALFDHGGQQVVLRGFNINPTEEYHCVFNNKSYGLAQNLSTHQATCALPSLPVGVVEVGLDLLSVTGFSSSNFSRLALRISPVPAIESIAPSTVAPGMHINARLKEFEPNWSVSCHFRNFNRTRGDRTSGTVINSTNVVCRVPEGFDGLTLLGLEVGEVELQDERAIHIWNPTERVNISPHQIGSNSSTTLDIMMNPPAGQQSILCGFARGANLITRSATPTGSGVSCTSPAIADGLATHAIEVNFTEPRPEVQSLYVGAGHNIANEVQQLQFQAAADGTTVFEFGMDTVTDGTKTVQFLRIDHRRRREVEKAHCRNGSLSSRNTVP